MKKKTKIIISVVCAVLAVGIAAVAYSMLRVKKIEAKETLTLSSVGGVDAQDITLTAHRGLSAQEPENTLPAIKAACEAGFDYVEFDIRQTSDGEWVVMHDDKLRRMTDGSGKVSGHTYNEILNVNIDNGANIDNYTSLKVPTFSEVMELMEPFYPDVRPMIEIKGADAENLGSLIDIIKEYEQSGKSTAIISFDIEVLKALKAECPNQDYWYLTSKLSDEALEICRENGMRAAFDGNDSDNTVSRINTFSNAGIELAAWTIDDPEDMKTLYNAGVRYFTTNRIIP